MARVKDEGCLQRGSGIEFDRDLMPDALTPVSGIYRCAGCGREEASRFQAALPPRDHHRHRKTGTGSASVKESTWAT